jgi:hypothetical protein
MSGELYERYLDEGPESLSIDELRAALDWKDEHPTESLRHRQDREVAVLQAQDRANLKAEFLRQGGTPEEFERYYQARRDQTLGERVEREEAEAHRASFNRTRSTF